ncbi:MAG: DUF397 domain-containing protein [Acidimicrobiales bacterium]
MTDDSCDPTDFDAGRAKWRKSSYSAIGECVEVAVWSDQIAVRNSNRPEGETIFFSRDELSAWLAGIKAGEFDDLT